MHEGASPPFVQYVYTAHRIHRKRNARVRGGIRVQVRPCPCAAGICRVFDDRSTGTCDRVGDVQRPNSVRAHPNAIVGGRGVRQGVKLPTGGAAGIIADPTRGRRRTYRDVRIPLAVDRDVGGNALVHGRRIDGNDGRIVPATIRASQILDLDPRLHRSDDRGHIRVDDVNLPVRVHGEKRLPQVVRGDGRLHRPLRALFGRNPNTVARLLIATLVGDPDRPRGVDCQRRGCGRTIGATPVGVQAGGGPLAAGIGRIVQGGRGVRHV